MLFEGLLRISRHDAGLLLRQSQNIANLSLIRRQRLDELGFIWDEREADWKEGFNYLKVYKNREGHCNVPKSHKENEFSLGLWVSEW
jgi:hypothetical protein